jgi:ribosomal protein S3
MASVIANRNTVWNATKKPGMYNPPPNSTMTDVNVTVHRNKMGQVIGEKGCFFKELTENVNGVYYIWHDRKRNSIEVYGEDSLSVFVAEVMLKDRMKNL